MKALFIIPILSSLLVCCARGVDPQGSWWVGRIDSVRASSRGNPPQPFYWVHYQRLDGLDDIWLPVSDSAGYWKGKVEKVIKQRQ